MHYCKLLTILKIRGTNMKIVSITIVASTIALIAGTAQASDINQTCLEIVESDGGTNGSTAAACACVAEKSAGNADVIANIELALATPSGPDREAAYSPETLAVIEACGPWE